MDLFSKRAVLQNPPNPPWLRAWVVACFGIKQVFVRLFCSFYKTSQGLHVMCANELVNKNVLKEIGSYFAAPSEDTTLNTKPLTATTDFTSGDDAGNNTSTLKLVHRLNRPQFSIPANRINYNVQHVLPYRFHHLSPLNFWLWKL